MCLIRNIVTFYLFISVSFAKNATKESIGFPEQGEEVRQPVYIPAVCPANELFYPGDQKDDWICDCRPAYIYHPKTDKCWPAFRRGPCDEGYYLVVPENSAIPICEKNPCVVDNYVTYKGRCERLDSMAPCRSLWPIPAALSVNGTDLAITCERLNFESRFGEPVPAQLNAITCPPGCRRNINGKCMSTNILVNSTQLRTYNSPNRPLLLS